jgi:hypothetical protein
MSTPPSRRQSWANVSLAQATGLAPMLVNTKPAHAPAEPCKKCRRAVFKWFMV